jgi:glycosyltransferase involved in cell wall biosynthesis
LLRRKGSKLRILMLGDGQEYIECRSLAERLGLLEAGVLLMKPRIPKQEVPGVLAAMDIAVLPGSTDIICPIKIQEYMAAELPSVLPDYPANREVIVQGETGMLFRPKDEQSLADALLALAKDAALRQRMGVAARAEVMAKYTWEHTWGAAMDEILRRVGQA